jgi:8-oxo-dGTP pyrophosphatase MutT (NUDIX family)
MYAKYMYLNHYLNYIQELSYLPVRPSPTLAQLNMLRNKGIRPNVSACIISSDNYILVAYSFKHSFWFLPQGGIDNGETAEMALKRETAEEVGTTVVKTFTNEKPQLIFSGITPMSGAGIGSRQLQTDEGRTVVMKAKFYFYYLVRSKANSFKSMVDKNAEYQQVKWLNAQQFRQTQNEIKSPHRKRQYEKVTQILVNNNLLI